MTNHKNQSTWEDDKMPSQPPMMLLSLQRDSLSTWSKPRHLFFTIHCAEEPPTTPLEISKTLSRLPYSVRSALLIALDAKNQERKDGLVWTISNIWTWSKKANNALQAHQAAYQQHQQQQQAGLNPPPLHPIPAVLAAQAQDEDPNETLQDVVAYLTLVPGEKSPETLPDAKEFMNQQDQ